MPNRCAACGPLCALMLAAAALAPPSIALAQSNSWVRATSSARNSPAGDSSKLYGPADATSTESDNSPTPYGNAATASATSEARIGFMNGACDAMTTDPNLNGSAGAIAEAQFHEQFHVVSNTLAPGTLVTIQAVLAGTPHLSASGYDSYTYAVGLSASFTAIYGASSYHVYADYDQNGLRDASGPLTFQVAVGDSFQASGDLQLQASAYYGSVPLPSLGHSDAGTGFFAYLNSQTAGAILVSGSCIDFAQVPQPFSSQPVPQTVTAGSSAQFTVASARYGPYTYQWRRNGVPLTEGEEFSGTQLPTLNINPASVADDGLYDVIVTATCAIDTSAAALLVVNTAAGVPTSGSGELALGAPAPNPTRSGAEFALTVPRPMAVRVEIDDLAGRRIAVLLDGQATAGRYALRWDGLDASGARAAPGIYRCRLVAEGASALSRSVAVVR